MAKSVNMEMNNFVLTSILTVDDFCQFKAMMVKRNMDLTNEVRFRTCNLQRIDEICKALIR